MVLFETFADQYDRGAGASEAEGRISFKVIGFYLTTFYKKIKDSGAQQFEITNNKSQIPKKSQ